MRFKKRRYFLIPLLIIIFIFLFLSIYYDVERQTVKKAYSQLNILTKQTGKGIELFFKRYYSELRLLAYLKCISNMDSTGENIIKDFYNISSGDISGITRVNKNGVIVYTFPYAKNAIGKDIRYQDHIRYILKEKKPVLSDVFMTVQGFRTIAYHVPIFDNGKFNGTIAILIPFKTIADNFLQSLKRGISVSVWMISREGIILYSNEKKMVGEKMVDFVKSDSQKKIIEKMSSGFKDDSSYIIGKKSYLVSYSPVNLKNTYWSIAVAISRKEALATMKSFKDKWTQTIVFLVIIGFLYIYFMIKAATVLKERRRRERIIEALKESEENFRLVVEQSPVAIALFDQKDRIKFLNKRFMEIFGYKTNKIKDLNHMWKLMVPELKTRKKIVAQWKERIVEPNQEKTAEWSNIRFLTNKKGSRRIDIIAGNLEGRKIIIFNDITGRVRALKREEKLREELNRSKKMEALGLLAGSVAHDLNNILSLFVTYPELIKREFPENKKLKKHIEKLEKAGERASAVVSDLLTVTRGVSSKKKVANLINIISDFISSIEFLEIRKRFPEIKFQFNSKIEKAYINCSQFHIEKMVMNLILNAFEAIDRSGVVKIGVDEENPDSIIHGYENIFPGKYIVLSVSDNGIGLSRKDKKNIFDPFYSGKLLGKSGSGLGLTIVWNAVKDHKAKIDIMRNGGWTTFKIYFPKVKKKVKIESRELSLKFLKGSGESVLIIDDERDQREIGKAVLDSLGYNVVTVPDGESALRYLKKKSVDVILLDMIMKSGISGAKIYKKLSEINPSQRVLIVSGFSRSDETEKILQFKNTDYIRKPYTIKTLGLALKDLLEKS